MLKLAQGVEFLEDAHEYWYKGKQLSGVTGLIASKLGIKMPEEFVGEHQAEGTHVHKAVQKWIETGDAGSVHPGVTWATGMLRDYYKPPLHSEVLVSDFKRYASAVDIMAECPDGTFEILDIKKGVFKRD
jgi:hypothetical protein